MRFQESKFADLLQYSKIELSFGNYYLCNQFIIAEINEGTHLDWDKILEIIGVAIDFYGPDIKIAYISNRVESYSLEPQLWYKFHKEFDFIVATATIAYNDFGYINATIEKNFTNKSLKRCDNLEEAINWVKNLKEFNQN